MNDYPGFFADAETNYKDSKFVIFSVPYDETCSYRKGSKKAPVEIRKASWNYENYDMFLDVDLTELKIHDYGDLLLENFDSKNVNHTIKKFFSKILKDKKFPIMIGGEHSITIAAVQSLPEDTAVLVLDAHLDFRRDYQKDEYSHACVNRRIVDHVGIKNTVVLGVRSSEKKELMDAKKQNLFFIDSFEIQKNGIESSLKKISEKFKNKKIYLSVDMDVFDPCYAPGVGTPEPFGISSYDFLKIIDMFKNQFIGFDIVEVNPDYDSGDITSFLTAKLIRIFIAKKF